MIYAFILCVTFPSTCRGLSKMDTFLQTTYSKYLFLMIIVAFWFKVHCSVFLIVQLTKINTGWGNNFVLSGNKPSLKLMLIKFHQILWHDNDLRFMNMFNLTRDVIWKTCDLKIQSCFTEQPLLGHKCSSILSIIQVTATHLQIGCP